LDVQECPAADLAIVFAIVGVLKDLAAERWTDLGAQQEWPVGPVEKILLDCIEHAEAAVIRDGAYLESLGIKGETSCTAAEVWRHLIESSVAHRDGAPEFMPALHVILDEGPLARRLSRAVESR